MKTSGSARATLSSAGTAESRSGPALEQRSSPLVRRIAKEHNVDITGFDGSGLGGRVTKDDILRPSGGAGAKLPPRGCSATRPSVKLPSAAPRPRRVRSLARSSR